MTRTEFGYSRTSCDCAECVFNCHHMPGYLVPDDVERMYQTEMGVKCSRKDADQIVNAADGPMVVVVGDNIMTWARKSLLASPGATVMTKEGKVFRIPTLVPARQESGACRYLKDERCTIHEVSPFGCAFTDHTMSRAEIDKISSNGLKAILRDHISNGLYHQIWGALWDEGLRAPGPQEARQKMAAAWYEQRQTTAAPTIKELLDLKNWTESSGFTSVEGPICPNCRAKMKPLSCLPSGVGTCPVCEKQFSWSKVQTPLGPAWMTMILAKVKG